MLSAFFGDRRLRQVRPSLPHDFEGSDIERLAYWEQFCSWPENYYFKTIGLIRLLKPATVVEVGVAYGYHARAILSASSSLSYIGVDPYLPGYDENDGFAEDVCRLMTNPTPKGAFDRLFEAVALALKSEFRDRARLIRESSQDAAVNICDESVDFVFIDGDHRYQQVKEDLTNWWPKVRSGGVMCGDDWIWPDVSRAVKDFALNIGQEIFLIGSPRNTHFTWLIRKPALSLN